MEQRPFGTTGLHVSAIGLGAGHIGRDEQDDAAVERLLDTALELGVTFLDTARGYGRSEERLGRWLRRRRDEVVLSTKVGYDVPGETDWTAGAVKGGVAQACRLLQTDVIDVVFLHSCPLEVLERGDVVDALQQCVTDGSVRVAGYSGENAELAWAASSGAFGALQTSVNLADQWSSRNVLPMAAERGIGVVAKRPLANVAWRHATRPHGVYGETYWERLQAMGVDPGDGDWAATAARFSAFTAGVSTAIVGTSRPGHLAEAVRAVELGPLPDDERARWERAFDVNAADANGAAWAGEV